MCSSPSAVYVMANGDCSSSSSEMYRENALASKSASSTTQQGPLRCAAYNSVYVYVRKKERGVMVGKKKNNCKDTTKAK